MGNEVNQSGENNFYIENNSGPISINLHKITSDIFTEEWFKNKLEESIAKAGPRYTPEINVELPIVRYFG